MPRTKGAVSWTWKEIQLFKQGYSDKEIAKMTGRTRNAVSIQRARYCPRGTWKAYTAKEVERIMNAEYGEDTDLAKELGRTVRAIQQFRYRYKKLMAEGLLYAPATATE